MADSAESGGKASDLFLGVVDLFAIILPGALFAVVLWKAASVKYEEFFRILAAPEVIPKWLVFLIVAYILGHFLSAASSWIMDPLYGGYYKYEFELKKDLPSLRRRADRLFSEVLGEKKLYWEVDNRLTWAESFLRIGNAAATAQLDRLEADSKFFRSLATVAILSVAILFSPLTSWTTVPQWYRALVGAGGLLLLLSLVRRALTKKEGITKRVKLRLLDDPGPPAVQEVLPSRLSWPDEKWVQAEEEVSKEDAGKIRWFAIVLPLVWLVFVLALAWNASKPEAWVAAGFFWLLTIISARRFMEIRAKRLAQAYYFAIALNKMSVFNPTPVEKKA